MSAQGALGAPAARSRVSSGARLAPAHAGRARATEGLLCACVLAALAVAMCAAHVRSGGLYYDDWSLLELARFPGAGGLLHDLLAEYGQRPGQALYYAALDRAFGEDASARLALAAAALALEAGCLYALLRRLGLGTPHAGAIAALLLVFPFDASSWLWGVMSLSSLAIAAVLLAVPLALRALQLRGARALALHGLSLALYLASALSYEVFAPAACLAGVLYVRAVGLRRARLRWSVDVLVITGALALTRGVLPADVATPSRTQTLAGMLTHAGAIALAGARVAGAAALPLAGLDPFLGAAALCAVLAVAALLRGSLADDDPLCAELARWLSLAGAGALLAAASWALYVPAAAHYTPTTAGTVDRVNAAAAIGLVLLVYAAAVLLVRMLARLARLPAGRASAVLLALALALGAAYLGRTSREASAWDAAAAEQRHELVELRAALPRLARFATVYVYGAPSRASAGVPVLGTKLDLSSALRLAYGEPSLVGVPLSGPRELRCRAGGVLGAGVAGAYGSSYLVDAGARRAVALHAGGGCVIPG